MQKSKHIGYEFDQSPFYYLTTKKKLISLLYLTKKEADTVLIRLNSLYLEREITNSHTGKPRHIEEPKFHLKLIQKRIEQLLKRIKIPDYIHAPGKNRSYITNASAHLNTSVIRKIDIAEYFQSTSKTHVYHFFNKKMKCSPDVSDILARLLTFNNHLPTGSPSSPILSYFSYLDMWSEIHKIAENEKCNLTVYMDDITISGGVVPDRLIWEIEKQFHRNGLRSNKKKEKYYVNKRSCEVTGVIITRKSNKAELKAPNRQYMKIYEIKNSLNLYDKDFSREQRLRKLQGLESQICQIEEANKF